jgi:hypothetical protein
MLALTAQLKRKQAINMLRRTTPMNASRESRKSLMVTPETHARLTHFSDKFSISQPDLIDALLSCVDEVRLNAAIAERARRKEAVRAEEERKQALLKKALSTMSADALEALLSKGAGS